MSKIIKYMPELQGEEQLHVAALITDMTDAQAEHFAHVYRTRRKDPTTTLILSLIGLFAIAGIHRFYLDRPGLGILWLLTGGLCFVGTIVDAVNYKSLTAKYNIKQAEEVAMLIRGAIGERATPRLPGADQD